MKKGDKIKIIRMDDNNGIDLQARSLDGRIVTVDYIDDIGQIHVKETGLAIIPEVDMYLAL